MICETETITLAEVAKRANVAVRTASKVFRNDPTVRSYIRERVLEEARKSNYTPNPLAQAMRTKKLNLVSFHIADLDNPFFATLFEKIARKLGQKNMMVVPCDGVDSVNEANQAVFACATLLANAHGDKIRQVVQSGPVVTISSYEPQVDIASDVSIDFAGAYEAMVEKILSAGQRKIGFLCPADEYVPNKRKFEGIESFLAKSDLKVVNGKPFETPEELIGSCEASPGILDTVFCTNDLYAVKLMRKLTRQGIRVPEDMVVVGCDGTFLLDGMWSLYVDIEKVSEAAVTLLMDALDGCREKSQVVITPELIIPQNQK
jgi:DNA-binding LacI/PurR family transcriptional regulator